MNERVHQHDVIKLAELRIEKIACLPVDLAMAQELRRAFPSYVDQPARDIDRDMLAGTD